MKVTRQFHKSLPGRTILGFCLLITFSACEKNKCREDEGSIKSSEPLKIIRLEDSLAALGDKNQTRDLLKRHPLYSENYLQWSKFPEDSILVSDVFHVASTPFNDTLCMDVRKEFPDMNFLQQDLSSFFDHVRFYYPTYRNPVIYTLTAAYGVDIEVKDSVIILGLEYFLSDSSRYIPRDPVSGMVIPAYIRKRMKKRYILPSIAMVIGDRYCKADVLDNTMLGEMMKWGRIYYFMERTNPCMPDSILTGYSAAELDDVRQNLPSIWAHYSENKLFFSTDLFQIRKYCDERPNVVEIGDKCPGRIGRWLGWQIVRKWALDRKIPMQKVMQETDARKIFSESGFKP
jgi:hypothetical protein